MNKRFLTGFLFLTVLSLGIGALLVYGANSGDAEAYYPMKTGSLWSYKVTLPDKTTYSQIMEVSDPDDKYIRQVAYVNNQPAAIAYFIQNEQGILKTKEIYASGTLKFEPMQMVLPANLKVGSTWSWLSVDQKAKETGIVVAEEKVTVTAGTFDTILIQSDGVDKDGVAYVDRTWFAKGIGYVKNEVVANGETVTRELVEYKLAN